MRQSNNREILLSKALYPSLITSYSLVPPHLGKQFLEVYSQIRDDRLYAKKNGLKTKNETYKLALNGTSGNYQNEYSWLYSPKSVMQIRINGQLLLLMLTEKLIEAGAKIKQLNTDGVLYVINKDVDVNSILKEWEEITKLTLETEEFEKFYQFAVNDYLAIGKGYSTVMNNFKKGIYEIDKKGNKIDTVEKIKSKYLKYKGLFIPEVTLGKGMQPLIIPKAINNYFADGIPIEQTIYNCKDINDFITYQKVGKQFYVEYKNQRLQHINRFYASTNGAYICKVKNTSKGLSYEKLIATSGVTVVNDLSKIKGLPNNINYLYYIKEIRKIIDAFEVIQLSLFD